MGFNVNSVFEKVRWFEIEKFNYLSCSIIWFDLIQKCWIEIEIWFGYLIFNTIIWIELKNELNWKKVSLVQKSIAKHSLVWTLASILG